MTFRNVRSAVVRKPLTDLENDVMRTVWSAKRCSVEDVHRVISRTRSLKETTVRTLLRRLEQKGYIRHEAEGRAYVYRAVEPARSIAARAVRQIIDHFCHGSVEELLSGMVESKMLSDEELGSLTEFVRSREKETE